jgi:hypothetical protein
MNKIAISVELARRIQFALNETGIENNIELSCILDEKIKRSAVKENAINKRHSLEPRQPDFSTDNENGKLSNKTKTLLERVK